MMNYFRVIGLIEGTSLLVLLFIAIPAKYYWGYPGLMPFIGWGHGLLFLIFLVSSLVVSHRFNWSIGFWFLVFLTAFFPFGTFLMDFKLKKIACEN